MSSGLLLGRHLITFRAGEPALHPITNTVIRLPSEMIKIKGKSGWRCLFLTSDNRCSIYQNRPLECRVLKCWDPEAVEDLFLKEMLTRDQVVKNKDLVELIGAYDDRLPAEAVYDVLTSHDEAQAMRLISIDNAFRKAVISNFQVDEAEMDFLFGRSVETLVRLFWK